MKITREQIHHQIASARMSGDVNRRTDKIMALIEHERKPYQALVDAAIVLNGVMDAMWNGDRRKATDKEIERAQQVIKKFIQPPPSIADRLDALGKRFEASSIEFIAEAGKELRAIAAEYREKHGV